LVGPGGAWRVVFTTQAQKDARKIARSGLRDKAEEGRDFVVTRGRQAKEQATQWAEKGRETLGKHKESLSTAIDAGVQAYREATSEGSKSKV